MSLFPGLHTPGLVDLQVNGYAGIDFNDATLTAPALDHALRAMLRAGVTTCLPTLITADEATLAARLAALDAAVAASRLGPLMVPGFHLEGPFLNPAPGYAGCHPPAAMVAPDPALLDRVVAGRRRPVLLLTLAPERPGALRVIAAALARGTVVAMGHTAADATVTEVATAAGVVLSTHLGNALPQPQPKFLNPLMAQLGQDSLSASFIADGIHIPPAVLKVMLRAKTPARSILVTDATSAAAAPPGLYGFAGMRIEHAPDGSVRVPGTATLAGSALTLDQAVRNVVAWRLTSRNSALAMASAHPAALLAPALRHHGLSLPASEVIWDAAGHAVRVRLAGEDFSATC
ncbi:N-acetylglucosamine-6-phosphate deacetylase [Rhodopila sp.]|uniref:N-acetylglucosamine-6-phosphate deacetylase n=1 Tax=Rhodopila sp. TaxID=2480087 RepID=UPI002B657A20|nr:amidohydrolase family protein [Rhodopila sp.]HVZ08377.1 amidohydrolase family protein [Rhodopila sp.]